MLNSESLARLKIISAMLIFGTIGVFRNQIPLPSAFISLTRGLIGAAFLLLVITLKGQRLNISAIKGNFLYLAFSGAALGLNWVLLFEAYNYTTVAAATLYYYLAPVIIVLSAAVLFKERLTIKSVICSLIALCGMVPVSGVLSSGLSGINIKGLGFGVGAAFLYASVVLLNKKIKDIPALDKSFVQLLISAIVLIPYVAFSGQLEGISFTYSSLIMIIILGIVHTGVAYALYFGAIKNIKASVAAILSYIDPVFAIVLSSAISLALPDKWVLIGGVMILGSTFISEIKFSKE